MNRKHGLLNFVLLGLLLFTASAANAAKKPDPFEMSEQMDAIDKQDFLVAIERATSCIHGRNFTCAESELAKAAKATSSGQDKKTLLASRQNMANEKQLLANEIRQAEEARQAERRRVEQEEEARQAERRRAEQEEEAQQERYRRQEQAAREAEDRESTSDAWADVGRHIQQVGAENAATLNRMNRQTIAAMNETNRRLAAQAAERDRARAEREEREADRRRDAAREREARERAAREEADRAARVRVAAAQEKPFSTYSQPKVVIEPGPKTCPPGSKPAGWTTPSTAVCVKDPKGTAGQVASGQGSDGNSGGSAASGSATATSTSRNAENSGGAKAPASSSLIHRKKFVMEGFNDNGSRAAKPELAIEQDIAQLKRKAEETVAKIKYNGSVPIHGVITDMRVREGCTAYKQYEGDYWAKCILDITYEADSNE